MTEEEKNAIKELNLLIKVFRNSIKEEEPGNWDSADSIEIVLNLIQKQQKELEKKDKIIDLMANYIYASDYRSECGNTREQVKQYFEKKVEDKQ